MELLTGKAKEHFTMWLEDNSTYTAEYLYWDISMSDTTKLAIITEWFRTVHLHFIIVNIMNSDDYEISVVEQPGHILHHIDDRGLYDYILPLAISGANDIYNAKYQ